HPVDERFQLPQVERQAEKPASANGLGVAGGGPAEITAAVPSRSAVRPTAIAGRTAVKPAAGRRTAGGSREIVNARIHPAARRLAIRQPAADGGPFAVVHGLHPTLPGDSVCANVCPRMDGCPTLLKSRGPRGAGVLGCRRDAAGSELN